MALSNLIVEKLEKFGGVDLKRDYRKYFSNALGISIALHLLVIFFYLGWTWFSDESDKNVPRVRIHSIAELAPPPSTQDQPQEAQPVAPPPPSADVVKPNLGIPVAVPDAVAPQLTMPDVNQPTAPTGVPTGNGPVTELVPQNNAPVAINVPVQEEEPDKDQFIDLSDEPAPIKPIESLIEYPEAAKRAGLQGKVVVSALIGKDGRVEKVDVIKADYDLFKQAAVDAIMKAKYTPARQNGTPVRVWVTQNITFRLTQ